MRSLEKTGRVLLLAARFFPGATHQRVLIGGNVHVGVIVDDAPATLVIASPGALDVDGDLLKHLMDVTQTVSDRAIVEVVDEQPTLVVPARVGGRRVEQR